MKELLESGVCPDCPGQPAREGGGAWGVNTSWQGYNRQRTGHGFRTERTEDKATPPDVRTAALTEKRISHQDNPAAVTEV